MVVAIDDTLYPTLIGVPEDTTVECHLPDVPHVTVEDDCDKLLTPVFTQEETYRECPWNYVATRRWSATDRCQNTVEESQRVTVIDDGPPTLDGVPEDGSIGCKDHIIHAKVTAADECEIVINVHIEENLVPGSCRFQYVTILTWSAEDKCGNSVVKSQTITVHDNVAPELSEPPEHTTVLCDAIPSAPHVTAMDDCSYLLDVTYKEYTESGSCDNDYRLKRVWSAVDECGNKASVHAYVNVYDDVPPQFEGFYPADLEEDCFDISLMEVLSTSDNCEGYIRFTSGENRLNGSCPHDYRLVRWYHAVDVCGNENSKDYTVTVVDNDDPVLSYIAPSTTCECDDPCEKPDVTGSDSCGYSATVDFNEITQDGTCEEERTLFRTWTAHDECEQSAEYVQTVHVVDTTPPVLEVHDDIVAEIGNIPPPWKCRWTDNCDDDGETDFARRRIDGTCEYTYTLVYSCVATDCVGNTATTSHAIHVFDRTAPVIIGVGPDVTVEYQKIPLHKHGLIGVSVTDNSDSDDDHYAQVVVKLNDDVIIPGYDENSYHIIRTYWAKDACGIKLRCIELLLLSIELLLALMRNPVILLLSVMPFLNHVLCILLARISMLNFTR
eukprot:TRINITY_DN8_c1_g1_i7.p1 TRINITY_DN8_c1_g1~~TRINITY_DN8_c1_g1_i7.p1  ORF type:complete len:709 (+),score=218.59 TRINITY_DN8_c1_g1_i7:300-2129(+)